MINTNILGATSGSDPVLATALAPVDMPKIVTVKAGSTITLDDYIEGTVTVNALYNNGTMGEKFALDTTATATTFAISDSAVLTPPTPSEDSEITKFVVKYQRKAKEGIAIYNESDKFPGTIKLTLKALCVDPCSADTLRACYIVFPSFQVSPEVSISLN